MDHDISSLRYRITRVMVSGKVRFILQERGSLRPSLALSTYEAHLSKKHHSHNTVYTMLNNCLYLWTWADLSDVNLDSILFRGETLETRQVNAFAAWLEDRKSQHNGETISKGVVNSALSDTSKAIRWFAENYATFDYPPVEREIQLEIYLESIRKRFANKRVKEKKKKEANDLAEDEITKIEQFLKPENRLEKNPKLHPAQVLRDYLVWRLAIEFGFREGEILALRLEDCPHRSQRTINIVRVEERGSDYVDPRGVYAPRPKTLSRKLGFILTNSPIPKLITDYITKHRRRKVVKHGRKVFQPILDIPAFLILSHDDDSGNPLSLSSIQDLAAVIRKGTGIKNFHWHIVRHAFFNRAYASIMDFKEKDKEMYKARLTDLVWWGGWENEGSLQLYVNRARRERGQKALYFYQVGSNEWEALR